jgi:DNA-binding PadR family transcriptional regulator
MEALSPTARVILGMLALGKQTGYEIKQLVDKSTRHFWAASYGQIYPELRGLEEQGLVAGRAEPAGGRARQVYELTDAGRDALRAWLLSDAEPVFELRCETLLKVFFSDIVGEQARSEQLRAFRALQERKLAQLRAIDSPASEWVHQGPYISLRFGIALTEWIIDWCREAEGLPALTATEEA